MEVVFVLKTPTKSAAECILCAPLARNRVAAEAGQGREEPTKIGGGPAREGGAGAHRADAGRPMRLGRIRPLLYQILKRLCAYILIGQCEIIIPRVIRVVLFPKIFPCVGEQSIIPDEKQLHDGLFRDSLCR